MSKGKRYPEEFKLEAVKQVSERGYSVMEVATRLDISTKTLYHWVAQFGEQSPRKKDPATEQAEIARLKSELKRVTEERDILKKAAAYFANDHL